jgi:hypothetical protein
MSNYLLVNAQGVDRVMISDRYKNMDMRQKGTVQIGSPQATPSGVRGAMYQGTIDIAGLVDPCIAISGGRGCLVSRVESNGVHRFTLGSDTPTTLTYYVFDVFRLGSTATYGLVVRNEANEVIFDATRKYLRVFGALTGPGAAIDIPPGRQGAVLLGYGSSRLVVTGGFNPPPRDRYWDTSITTSLMLAQMTGSRAEAVAVDLWFHTRSGGPPGSAGQPSGTSPYPLPPVGNWGSLACNHLAIDVTAY